MMKNVLFRFLCLALLAGLFFGVLPVNAKDADKTLIGLIEEICDFYLEDAGVSTPQAWLNGALAEEAGSASDWNVIALRQYESGLDFTVYAEAMEAFLRNHQTASASTRLRYALALTAAGSSNSTLTASILADSIGEQGIMSWIFGLHLLSNGVIHEQYTPDSVIDILLSLRLDDGGWALTGTVSDVDVTAMTLQALAPYNEGNHDVGIAVDGALACLSEKQLADGGYQSYGVENPESTAQVMVALTALGIDPLEDERFIKNGSTLLDVMLHFQRPDGSFSHTENGEYSQTATSQVFYALISLWRQQTGRGPLYIFTSDESGQPTDTDPVGAETDASQDTLPLETGNSVEQVPDSETNSLFSQYSSGFAALREKLGYKLWVGAGILAAVLIVCVILRFCGKRHRKNYLFVCLIGILLLVILLLTDFQSAGDYYSGTSPEKSGIAGTVTLSIRCDTIVGKSDAAYIPADGVILPVTAFSLAEGETVFDILTEAARTYRIQVDSSGSLSGASQLVYISGINYLYEFDFGDLSGWVYHVNGTAPSVGCGEYV